MTQLLALPELEALRALTVDGWWLMLTRSVRHCCRLQHERSLTIFSHWLCTRTVE